MWEYCGACDIHCEACDIPYQSTSLLKRYNDCPKHNGRLKALNMFPLMGPNELILLYVSRSSQKIPRWYSILLLLS